MKPTIHITNWASRGLHGPGRKLTIMRKPRAWEHGDGRVGALTPSPVDLEAIQTELIGWDEYERRCRTRFLGYSPRLKPGELWALRQGVGFPVTDGDTLLCSCSRDQAKTGRCHRVIAADLLARAGWNVILDGEPYVL